MPEPFNLRLPGGPAKVIWEGQSNLYLPITATPGIYFPYEDSVPMLCMSERDDVPFAVVGIGGTGFYRLLDTIAVDVPNPTTGYNRPFNAFAGGTESKGRGVYRQFTSLNNVVVMLGGTSDVTVSADAATIYADFAACADAYRAAGADYVIVCTITPYGGWSGPVETKRVDANALILADASAKFDAYADIAGASGLNDASSSSYLGDQLHLSEIGALQCADIINPLLDVALDV